MYQKSEAAGGNYVQKCQEKRQNKYQKKHQNLSQNIHQNLPQNKKEILTRFLSFSFFFI
jgi:hypothetical protein